MSKAEILMLLDKTRCADQDVVFVPLSGGCEAS